MTHKVGGAQEEIREKKKGEGDGGTEGGRTEKGYKVNVREKCEHHCQGCKVLARFLGSSREGWVDLRWGLG